MEDLKGKWLINIDLPYYFCTTREIFPPDEGEGIKYKNPGYTVQMYPPMFSARVFKKNLKMIQDIMGVAK